MHPTPIGSGTDFLIVWLLGDIADRIDMRGRKSGFVSNRNVCVGGLWMPMP